MPPSKSKKQRYNAQAVGALQGVRIVPQASRTAAGGDPQPQTRRAESKTRAQIATTEDVALIEKLIDFIKSMD
jgi:hypothetical protein